MGIRSRFVELLLEEFFRLHTRTGVDAEVQMGPRLFRLLRSDPTLRQPDIVYGATLPAPAWNAGLDDAALTAFDGTTAVKTEVVRITIGPLRVKLARELRDSGTVVWLGPDHMVLGTKSFLLPV